MTRLFIELYLDEDVDVLLAELLRARGFSVLTTREAGQLTRSDVEQLAYAVAQERAFLTHNRVDFAELAQAYLEEGRQHHGIILAVRRSTYELARRVLVILNSVTADEMRDQVRYI